MRTLNDHIVNPANDKITITVGDEPGSGGANHLYEITGFETGTNPSLPSDGVQPKSRTTILFQNGPINEVGVNGVTHEALLAILADRLRGFQGGKYANEDNALALAHIEAAQSSLQMRTRARIARGVEGTHTV